MPLDIRALREYQGGEPEKVRESQRRRFADVGLVDAVIAEDEKWRVLVKGVDNAKEAKNRQQKEITTLKKAKEEVPPAMLEELKRLDGERGKIEAQIEPQAAKARALLAKIGNLVDDGVPVSQDEDADNEVVSKWGEPLPQAAKSHHELLYMIGGYEPERGSRVAGHRAYFFTDVGVLLNQAVINYGIAFLRKKGYCVMQPPFFMNKDVMAGVAQLEQFDEELYKVSGGGNNEEKYLIATSEQPICAFHKGEWLQEQELPKRYAGVSTCFRKEAGSHGRDTWGIFRVHQFEKVEQFCVTTCDLEESRKMHEEMRSIAEEYVTSFGFPYRVVNIVSGELNNAAIKKYDLEAWFPFQQKYRELVSCSNCTDYQSRAMEIRCGAKKMGDKEKKYVHMLNSTLCACGRTICCLLENNQTPTGVNVPEVLRPYLPDNLAFLPFVRDMDGKPFESPDNASSPKAALAAKVAKQGDAIRDMKKNKAPAEEVTKAVDVLKSLKAEYLELTGEEYLAPGQKPKAPAKNDAAKSNSSAKKDEPPPKKKAQPAAKAPPPQAAAPTPKAAASKGNGKDDLLTGLEATLTLSTYVAGFEPSAEDAALYQQLIARGPLQPGPNVTRWMNHIASFPEPTRAAWK
mmetsp:Transcript_23649/g.75894  ORF Transcript_23649/g.75894 Transcript_23649/m.75894 type:complete len:629 (-) Transcript_23649:42-1928(-)